ncbi:MAG: hypothetical protein K8R48_07775 [Alphaproteobacteria bacterium]|nr:hypothetical protein [Alphaproteobacteria bacterium]
MQKKLVDYSVIRDLVDAKKKTVEVWGVDQSRAGLKTLIKLAKAFNKTISFKAHMTTVKIDKNTRLKDVFAKCKKIEAARVAPPSAKEQAKREAALREWQARGRPGFDDDGPYSGFMSD